MNASARVVTILGITWVLFLYAVYLPDLGRGFVKDDFAWIKTSRDAIAQPARFILPDAPGFYRPVVGVSFAADYAMHGLNPRGYGFTNLLLLVGCLAGLALVSYELRLSVCATAIALFVWCVNPHGINMALLWISGRSVLLLTMFSLFAAAAFLRGRRGIGALLLFAALLSKEEATVLPVILALWQWWCRPDRSRRHAAFDAVALVLPLVVYAILRMRTPAYVPATAPWFYQFTTDPVAIARNLFEYVDRGTTMALMVLALGATVMRARPHATDQDARVLASAAVWFAGGLAITIWLPVRSSLYAVFPAVGSALACGALIDAMRRAAPDRDRPVRLAHALACVLLAVPLYRSRDTRFVEPARVSQRTLRAITAHAAGLPAHGTIILEDEPDTKSNFVNAFGTLATEAIQLYTGRPLEMRIVVPEEARALYLDRDTIDIAAHYRLTKGRIERR